MPRKRELVAALRRELLAHRDCSMSLKVAEDRVAELEAALSLIMDDEVIVGGRLVKTTRQLRAWAATALEKPA